MAEFTRLDQGERVRRKRGVERDQVGTARGDIEVSYASYREL